MTTSHGHFEEAAVATRTIAITEVKANLLKLVTEIGKTGDEVIITRHGRPVATLAPAEQPRSLIGSVAIPDDLSQWDLHVEWSDPVVTDPEFGTAARG